VRLGQGPLRRILAGDSETVHPDDDRPRQREGQRVFATMMKMKKLDLPALERALNGQ
jgi:hypothetical protein